MKLTRTISAVLCAALLALSACSDSDDDATTTTQQRDGKPKTSKTVETADLPDGSKRFQDPQRSYEVNVDPAWEYGGSENEIEFWYLGESPTFRTNVNLLTQKPDGRDLEEYLDFSVKQAPSVLDDFSLIDRDVVDGARGELGVLEYTATYQGRPLHFFQTVSVNESVVAVATFTAEENEYRTLKPEVEPYFLTLATLKTT